MARLIWYVYHISIVNLLPTQSKSYNQPLKDMMLAETVRLYFGVAGMLYSLNFTNRTVYSYFQVSQDAKQLSNFLSELWPLFHQGPHWFE